jgi:hypothetical protein
MFYIQKAGEKNLKLDGFNIRLMTVVLDELKQIENTKAKAKAKAAISLLQEYIDTFYYLNTGKINWLARRENE